MNVLNEDYSPEDVVHFLKEEFERIITQYSSKRGESVLNDARAFAAWFLYQEAGISYQKGQEYVLDDTNDCGVDFIWTDKENHQILAGQIEYDTKVWSKTQANKNKAIETFKDFKRYLDTSSLPDKLHDSAKNLWREARRLFASEKFTVRYIYITPKHFTEQQIRQIQNESGIPDYEFFTYNSLIERGQEFLDGQTGMSSFNLSYQKSSLKIDYDFGNVYVINVSLKEIHRIVELHEKHKRLKSLFASNVRSYLNTKKRSKEIAEAMRRTIKDKPSHFLICNNGITIQSGKVIPKKGSLFLQRASISNGCQTAMNIDRFYKENEGANPKAEVLVTVIELKSNAHLISGEIARARNYQNPVDNRDLMSNDPLLVTLHHRLSADKLYGSDKRYYLLRKQGEKQTLLREEPDAKGKFMWIDADDLARCIAAAIRQEPHISQQGSNDIFGKYFKNIFPDVHDPTHSSCKYAFWIVKMINESYDSKARWKGINDNLIRSQKDFKGPSVWFASSLICSQLKEHFSFSDHLREKICRKMRKMVVLKEI